MNIPIQSDARLLFRVDPLPGESPRGYLCRVAQEHSYSGSCSLMQIAGLPPSGLDREDRVEQIAHVLRLGPEEWRAMCYRRIQRRDQFDQRSFYGKPISTDDLNYQRPRLCPACLRERPIWWAVWDLSLVAHALFTAVFSSMFVQSATRDWPGSGRPCRSAVGGSTFEILFPERQTAML